MMLWEMMTTKRKGKKSLYWMLGGYTILNKKLLASAPTAGISK